jgi:hypothetical protein
MKPVMACQLCPGAASACAIVYRRANGQAVSP